MRRGVVATQAFRGTARRAGPAAALRAYAAAAGQVGDAEGEARPMAEAGLPDFVAGTWNSIAVPAATPEPLVARLNALVNAVTGAPALRSRMAELGSITHAPMTPAQVDAFHARERALWIPVVRATGARIG